MMIAAVVAGFWVHWCTYAYSGISTHVVQYVADV